MKTVNMKKINKIVLSTLLILNAFNFVSAQDSVNYINVFPANPENTQCLTLNNNFKFKTNNKTFKSNDKNSNGEVSKLQNFLAVRGYLTGETANGNYGPATVKAVKEFQKANGLIVTGIVGKATRHKINYELCGGVLSTKIIFKKDSSKTLNQNSLIMTVKDNNVVVTENIKKLNKAIARIEEEIKSPECEKDKIDCDIAKYALKSIKENCFKLKESEIDNCVLTSMFSASIRVTGISQKREMEEAGKSKEAYESYLTKSGLDFKDGICDSFNSTISSGLEGYKYVEVCKDKQKTYSFTKEVNGINISISRGEYLDNLYSSFLKGLPKLLETYENMSQGKISL